jgi:hypothetical protein
MHSSSEKKQQLTFKRSHAEGLYEAKNLELVEPVLLTTINSYGNYTKEQCRRAENARRLHRLLGHPGNATLLKMLQNGTVLNTPVVPSDLALADQVLGGCIHCIQGKLTKKPQRPTTTKRSTIIGERVHIDLFHWAGQIYLIAIDEASGHMVTIKLKSKETIVLKEAIRVLIGIYGAIQTICTDREPGLTDEMALDLKIKIQRSDAEGHCHMAERGIRHLKNTIRSILAGCPIKIPEKILPYLVKYATDCINIRTNKTCPSGVTPYMLVEKRKVDIAKLSLQKFGDVVLTKIPYNKDSTNMRASVGIVIGRELTSRILTIYDLKSRSIVTRTNAVPVGVEGMEQLKSQLKSHNGTSDTTPTIPTVVEEEPVHVPDPVQENSKIQQTSPVDGENNREEDQTVVSDTQMNNKLDISGESNNNIIPNIIDPSVEPIMEQITPSVAPEVNTKLEPDTGVGADTAIDQDNARAEIPRRSNRTRKSTKKIEFDGKTWKKVPVSLMSVAQARTIDTEKTNTSLTEEIKQMIEKGVFHPVKFQETTDGVRIPSSVIVKPGKANFKSRLVAGGHRIKKGTEEVSGPTAKTESILTILSLVAEHNLDLCVADVRGAYLNAFLPKEKKVYMRLTSEAADEMMKQNVSAKKCVHNNRLYVRIIRALYGLRESGHLWNVCLTKKLKEMGYKQLFSDGCIFAKATTTIAIYVDDLLIASGSTAERDELIAGLEAEFGKMKKQFGKKLKYRGLDILRNKNHLEISQRECIMEITKLLRLNEKTATVPCSRTFMERPADHVLLGKDKDLFGSVVAKLTWLASQSRPDIKLATSVLARASSSPTAADLRKLHQVVRYLRDTIEKALVFTASGTKIRIYADASHGINEKSHGQSAIVVRLGDNTVYTESKVQKIVAQSTCESELYALNTAANYAIWFKNFMEELGHKQDYIEMFQDNLATISLMENGKLTPRTRHISQKYFRVHEMVTNKEIKLTHIPSEKMLADVLSKPTEPRVFLKHRDTLLNVKKDSEGGSVGDRLNDTAGKRAHQ